MKRPKTDRAVHDSPFPAEPESPVVVVEMAAAGPAAHAPYLVDHAAVYVHLPQMVAVARCHPNPWNDNEETPQTLARLVKEIQDVGFLEALVLVPLGESAEDFRILGGEHRWKAATTLQMLEVPAIILAEPRWQAEPLQKALSVRLNRLRGKSNPKKLAKLLNEFVASNTAEQVQDLLGVTDADQWREMVQTTRDSLLAGAATGEMLQEFDKKAKKAKSIDDLTKIVEKLYADYGTQTAPYSFITFVFAGREHTWVAITQETKTHLDSLLAEVARCGLDVNTVLAPVLKQVTEELAAMDTNPNPAEVL